MFQKVRYWFLLIFARAAVFWERLWLRVWPAAGVLGLYVAVALLDLLPALPGWLHGLVLVLFAGAFFAALRMGLRGLRPVGLDAARHRLELDSGLEHRPLTALEDHLAMGRGNPRTEALWQAHIRRMARDARNLRVRLPAPGLARKDPLALRGAVLLLLAVGVIAGAGNAQERLGRAMMPRFGGGMSEALKLDIWITPPAYTSLAPIFLQQGVQRPDGPIKVPVGSAVLAQAGGVDKAPRLKLGGQSHDFKSLGGQKAGSYRIESVIEKGDRLSVEVDDEVAASWAIQVIPDKAPRVEYTAPPASTGASHLRLAYEATDDYGLARLAAVIRLAGAVAGKTAKKHIRFPLPLPGQGARKAQNTSVHNLTAHPWAGLQVSVQLEAEDARGQKGTTELFIMPLPQRIFNHPVARAIVEQRKKLSTPSLSVIAEVIAGLAEIAEKPKLFHDDTVVFMALSISQARLAHDGGEEAVSSVQSLLWDTALRLEDGSLSIAEREFRRKHEELMKALRGKPSPKDVQRLMRELQSAMNQFFSALREKLQKEGLMHSPLDPNMRIMRSDDLQRMLDQARELARTGSWDAARRMLSRLQQLLNNMRAGLQRGKAGKQAAEARRLMDGLRGLTNKQQRLLDRTYRKLRDGPQAGDKRMPPGTSQDAVDQDAVRRKLGELMIGFDEVFGRIPQQLGNAERSMRDAVEGLTTDRLGAALSAQTRALEQLRQARSGAARQMARRRGGLRGVGRGQRLKGLRQPEMEPFGRVPDTEQGTMMDDDDDTIPTKAEIRRAHKILDELRRRAGDRARPKNELEYIDRLLRQF